MENKKWKKILIAFMALLLLALPTAPALPFIKGTVITAEAASKKVSLSKKKLSLAIAGKTTVQLRNINTKRKITWSSSNKKIASVKKQADGKAVVTGNKAGKAVITAKICRKQISNPCNGQKSGLEQKILNYNSR